MRTIGVSGVSPRARARRIVYSNVVAVAAERGACDDPVLSRSRPHWRWRSRSLPLWCSPVTRDQPLQLRTQPPHPPLRQCHCFTLAARSRWGSRCHSIVRVNTGNPHRPTPTPTSSAPTPTSTPSGGGGNTAVCTINPGGYTHYDLISAYALPSSSAGAGQTVASVEWLRQRLQRI